MMDTLEDNVVNIISHDWCNVPNHALGKRRKYLHRRAMINTLEDNVDNIIIRASLDWFHCVTGENPNCPQEKRTITTSQFCYD